MHDDINFVSLHDFDFGFFLKLLKGLNEINDVRIIGLPPKTKLDENTITKTVELIKKTIENIVEGNP